MLEVKTPSFISAYIGVEPGPNVVYVGDEPRIDAYGAHLAGLRGVWLDRPDALTPVDPAPPEWIERITTLADLPTLLATPAPAPAPNPVPAPNPTSAPATHPVPPSSAPPSAPNRVGRSRHRPVQ